MNQLRICAIIPTHDHVTALDAILSRLGEHGLPTIVIDDGSAVENGERIASICVRHDAEYQRHAFNGGKGFAVMCGLARAKERGFTHAVQIDADGQHDLDGLNALLEKARSNPEAIVTGTPHYDTTIPLARRIWRPFTNFWVKVNTLSLRIPDAMCGFRVYPVSATLDLVRKSVRGRRMDFDIEVLVKAHWARIEIVSAPVRVIYPHGNFSNFDLLRDNVLLSLMQARLFFGMLLRAPSLILRRAGREERQTRWPVMRERGAYWGLRALAGVYRLLGRTVCLAVMAPVILYFFATGREQREASRDYLTRLWAHGLLKRQPGLWTSFCHFMSFGSSALDKLAAWTGDIPLSQVRGATSGLLREVEKDGRGAFAITAHIGNPEAIRAVCTLAKDVPINVLMHTDHARAFNRLIKEFSPKSPVRAFPVTKVGVDTAIILSQAIANGEWVVMVGDRVPVSEQGRVVQVPFLGELAAFPQGPYILASILKAPTYLLFCTREGAGFDVHFEKFADPVELPRTDRIGAIRGYAALYAKALEARVAQTPLQWFNFYSFWRTSRDLDPETSAMQRVVE
ncbi:MAG TPA: glycosyltransferase [Rhizomicrobium sp.]